MQAVYFIGYVVDYDENDFFGTKKHLQLIIVEKYPWTNDGT